MNKYAFWIAVLATAPAAAQSNAPQEHPASATQQTPIARPAGAIDSRAHAVLHRMSDYLGSLPSFRVQSNAVDEVVQNSGQKLQWLSQSQVTVRRPNQVRSDRIGPVAHLTFRYDGRTFTLFGNRTGYYAIVPAPARLDEAIDTLRTHYGIDVPAADLLVPHAYEALMDDTRTGEYVGLEPIEGVLCHHLAYQGKDVDWQIWVQDGAQPLPRRMVITSRTMLSQPQFTVSLSHWETGVRVGDATFRFQPPPGATRIRMLDQAPATGRGGGEREGR